MTRVSSAALLTLAVASLPGCYNFDGEGGGGPTSLDESDVEDYTYKFTPDIPTGMVEYWYFDFAAPFETIYACNSNNHDYTATSWSVSGLTITLNYDNSQSEFYKITSITSDLSSGRFHYTNSIGTTPMDGDFQRLAPSACK